MADELTGWAKSVVLSDGYYPTDDFLWTILDDPEEAEARARFIWRLNPPPDHSLRACVSALLRAEMMRLGARAEKAEARLVRANAERDEARRIAGEWRDECCLGNGYAGLKEALPWEIEGVVMRGTLSQGEVPGG